MSRTLTPTSLDLPVLKLDQPEISMPTFTFVTNKVSLDGVEADLVLITKLSGADIPLTLHPSEPTAQAIIGRTLQKGWRAKAGAKKLMHVPLPNSRGEIGRHVLLVGLGSVSDYCGKVACAVFEALVDHAVSLNAETIVVPFVPNAMTQEALTHKATAFKLKSVVRRLSRERGGLGSLREIKIYCHSAAVPSIRRALQIEADCGCQNSRSCREVSFAALNKTA